MKAMVYHGPGKQSWQDQPDLSAQIEIRPAAKSVLEAETAAPVQSITGLRRALEDPRRGR